MVISFVGAVALVLNAGYRAACPVPQRHFNRVITPAHVFDRGRQQLSLACREQRQDSGASQSDQPVVGAGGSL